MNEEELYKKFCLQVKEHLSKILEPVIPSSSNRSYDVLTDVITNVILFEINIDKKPWEQIPKREVAIPTYDKMVEEAEWLSDGRKLANILMKKVGNEISYNDRAAENMSEEVVKSMGLYSALKNYLN